MVGRFILKVPLSTSRALAWMDSGLMSLHYRILSKQAKFIWNVTHTKFNHLLLEVLQELLLFPNDPWTKAWAGLQRQVGVIPDIPSKLCLPRKLRTAAAVFVMSVKSSHVSMLAVAQPWKWFRLQGHVNDSLASKYLCMVRGGNAQLGNRYKNRYGFKYEGCPSCLSLGLNLKLGEAHVLFGCPAVDDERVALNISA